MLIYTLSFTKKKNLFFILPDMKKNKYIAYTNHIHFQD
ncbi:hypothetical protein M149_0605 [Bacteroides fragilis str. 1007-1-F |nr:hypothetical protein M149_0605 [Bacteroides fragilis str. 1007-1-F \